MFKCEQPGEQSGSDYSSSVPMAGLPLAGAMMGLCLGEKYQVVSLLTNILDIKVDQSASWRGSSWAGWLLWADPSLATPEPA